MFFKLVLMCTALACVNAAPANTDVVPLEKQQPTVIPIVSQSEELEANGTYKFSYETGNGIKREETSYEKVIPKTRSAGSEEGGENDDSNEIHVQEGSYSYVAPDGTVISVKYIADENGFRPVGDHLPRAPGLVPQSSTGEKSGRALKFDLKKAESRNAILALSKSEPEKSSKEVASENPTSEVSSNSPPVKNEPTTLSAAEEPKANPDSTSPAAAAPVTETVAVTAAPEVPASTSVAATEAALNTKETSTAEVVSSAETSSTTQAASNSEVASTQSTAVESSPKSKIDEQSISTESATAGGPPSNDISPESANLSTASS